MPRTETTKEIPIPEDLRRVLDCAMAWKKYSDGIKDRGAHTGEQEAFMRGFVAGAGCRA